MEVGSHEVEVAQEADGIIELRLLLQDFAVELEQEEVVVGDGVVAVPATVEGVVGPGILMALVVMIVVVALIVGVEVVQTWEVARDGAEATARVVVAAVEGEVGVVLTTVQVEEVAVGDNKDIISKEGGGAVNKITVNKEDGKVIANQVAMDKEVVEGIIASKVTISQAMEMEMDCRIGISSITTKVDIRVATRVGARLAPMALIQTTANHSHSNKVRGKDMDRITTMDQGQASTWHKVAMGNKQSFEKRR